MCQGLLSCRRHIGKREDPGDEVVFVIISRKVVGKNMGHDQYTVPDTVTVEPTFVALKLANTLQWPLVPFFQISLKNSELKTTHNAFRDWRVHFFRQSFSKKLYMGFFCAHIYERL